MPVYLDNAIIQFYLRSKEASHARPNANCFVAAGFVKSNFELGRFQERGGGSVGLPLFELIKSS